MSIKILHGHWGTDPHAKLQQIENGIWFEYRPSYLTDKDNFIFKHGFD